MSKYTSALSVRSATKKKAVAGTIPRVIAKRTVSAQPKVSSPAATPTIVMPHHYAKPDAVNAAGGLAFRKSHKFELLSAVFCSLLSTKTKDKFYESESELIARLKKLVKQNPYFAAQAAIWARRVLGLRTISHALTALVCGFTKGKGWTWVRPFVQSVIYRPDDATEITAAYFLFFSEKASIRKRGGNGKKVPVTLPYPLKKGIAGALAGFDAYQLAKYRKSDQSVSLVDLFNLTHPKPRLENAAAFKDLVQGTLKNTDTWETLLSAAGTDKVKKEEVWCSLLEEKKLGYLAALKNARNIIEQAPGAVPALVKFLTNPAAVARSLVLPFQFVKAFEALQEAKKASTSQAQTCATASVQAAVEEAVELSVKNIPVLPGTTLITLDQSTSMGHVENLDSAAARGALFTAIALKSQPGADFMQFASSAKYRSIETANVGVFAIVEQIKKVWMQGSTNFHAMFECAGRKYDNIIILSDNEGWTLGKAWGTSMGAPTSSRRKYEQKFNTVPFIVLFDFQGYGQLMFPEDSVAVLAGFSDKLFALLAQLKRDPQALVHEVEQVNFAAINTADESA